MGYNVPHSQGSGSPLLERRGGIEPPHVRNVAYSHCFRFCFCTPRMSPLGHIVERFGEFCHFCPQPPSPKGGLSREEEMKRQGCRSPVTPSAPLMLIYFFQMLPFLVQLFAKSLNVDIRGILFLDCALLELAAFTVAGKRASPFFCPCNTS